MISLFSVAIDLFHGCRRHLRFLAKFPKSEHAHWVVGKCRTFRNDNALSKLSHYQPPNAHVRISGTLLSNAMVMVAAAMKKIIASLHHRQCMHDGMLIAVSANNQHSINN
jgi:hypothetical protein